MTEMESRADYHGYEQAAIEAWESIKAWNTRAEHGSGRTTDLLRELRDLACDINAAEIIDHVHITNRGWTFDSQWLDSWHNEFDRIADELEQAITAWNSRAERTCEDTGECRWFCCSVCGFGFGDIYINDERKYDAEGQPNYCPNCGAKVVGA